MNDFDDDMMRESFAYSGDDQVAAWENYRTKFALANKATRINDLRIIDTWLADPKPRKDVAFIWQKSRDLRALHENLMRIGK